MKKIIYIIVLTAVSCLAFTSCTEEKIKPAGGPPTQQPGGQDYPYKP